MPRQGQINKVAAAPTQEASVGRKPTACNTANNEHKTPVKGH